MGRNLNNFILYNNTFVLIVLFIMLATSGALAANENVRDAVLSSEEGVVSIDNSYLLKVDIEEFDFRVKVIGVVKDDNNYYVTYEFGTIDMVDSVWKKIAKRDVLTVSIAELGERDLGLFVAEELSELVAYTKRFLQEVQLKEKEKGESQKTVAKKYKGLLGRYLRPEEMTFAGYDPVIEPPVIVVGEEPVLEEDDEVEVIDVLDVIDEPDDVTGEGDNKTTNGDMGTTTVDVTAPVLTLNGDASLILEVGEAYVENGVIATDDVDGDISGQVTISGSVDTATVGEYIITYTATDSSSNSASVNRLVIVLEAPVDIEEPEPGPEPEPNVEPEPEPDVEDVPINDGV